MPTYTDLTRRAAGRHGLDAGSWPVHAPLHHLIVPDGVVVALRRGATIAAGGLADRTLIGADPGAPLVAARGVDDQLWWVASGAVWTDDDAHEHPQSIGVAASSSRERATIAGLSDRLGWEAIQALDAGRALPRLETSGDTGPHDRTVVFDGRLGHTVPTVVVVGRDVTRWGAGSTWSTALTRAMHGGSGAPGDAQELVVLDELLAIAGLRPVVVDVGSPRLRHRGIHRSSVQLLVR